MGLIYNRVCSNCTYLQVHWQSHLYNHQYLHLQHKEPQAIQKVTLPNLFTSKQRRSTYNSIILWTFFDAASTSISFSYSQYDRVRFGLVSVYLLSLGSILLISSFQLNCDNVASFQLLEKAKWYEMVKDYNLTSPFFEVPLEIGVRLYKQLERPHLENTTYRFGILAKKKKLWKRFSDVLLVQFTHRRIFAIMRGSGFSYLINL